MGEGGPSEVELKQRGSEGLSELPADWSGFWEGGSGAGGVASGLYPVRGRDVLEGAGFPRLVK